MKNRASPEVLAALREVLDNQISAGDPPEVAATLARLRREGVEEERAWRLLTAALLQELSAMMASGRTFDREGYAAALAALPELYDRT